MMKSTRNFMQFLAVALVTGVLFAPRAEATPIISVSPVSQNATVGGSVTADIVVSGLAAGTAVGGVNFELAFNNSVLEGTGFTLDPGNKMSPIVDFPPGSSGFGLGGTSPFDTFFISLLAPATLLSQQSGGFTLATLTFKAIGAGLSDLTLSVVPNGAFLSDENGNVLPSQASNGSVCVGDVAGVPGNCATVPEPATFGLLATGVAALVRRRRKT